MGGPFSPPPSPVDARAASPDASPAPGPGDMTPPPLGGNGGRCTTDTECSSGHCVMSICCAVACGKDAPESCGTTGACEATGAACAKYGKDTKCTPESCSPAGGGVYTAPGFCDGQGKCPTERVTMPCAGAPCEGTRCQMGCGPGKACAPGNFCKAGNCAPQAAAGEACTAAEECSSGFCADGVCCDKACTGACEACSKGKNDSENGRCLPVKSGVDPDDECSETDKTKCGNDGFCDGKGACRKYDASTTCKDPSCGAGFSTGAGKCDGKGTCKDGSKTNCQGGLRCVGDRCLTSCTSPSSCQKSSDICNSNGNACRAPIAPGLACKPGECQMGFRCAENGLCCKEDCSKPNTCAKTTGHCGAPEKDRGCVLEDEGLEGPSDYCASGRCKQIPSQCVEDPTKNCGEFPPNGCPNESQCIIGHYECL
jgi:hypothetical protein